MSQLNPPKKYHFLFSLFLFFILSCLYFISTIKKRLHLEHLIKPYLSIATLLLQVGQKEKTIMVGDMDIDVLAGKKAGIRTCAVSYGIGKTDDIVKAKPDYIIDDISKLKGIIS